MRTLRVLSVCKSLTSDQARQPADERGKPRDGGGGSLSAGEESQAGVHRPGEQDPTQGSGNTQHPRPRKVQRSSIRV